MENYTAMVCTQTTVATVTTTRPNDVRGAKHDYILVLGLMPNESKDYSFIYVFFVDVGYTFMSEMGFISNVLNGYFYDYFPRAANISLKLRQEQYREGFIYTTHPWLVSLYLNCSSFVLQGVKVQVYVQYLRLTTSYCHIR